MFAAGDARRGNRWWCDEAPIENAKISGDGVFFEMKIAPGTLTFDGTVSGDEIKFDVTGTQGDKYKLVCKRQSGRQ